jgi:putative intracellular protease/amidase
MTARVLFVTTSHGVMNDGTITGLWAEELATPYYALRDAGFGVTLASIGGGPIPFDPLSVKAVDPLPPSVARLLADRAAMQLVQITPGIDEADPAEFAAIYLPGGHGALWDMPGNAALAARLALFDAAGKPIAASCHGPAGLLGVMRRDGLPLVANRRLCAFTKAEEDRIGRTSAVPFLLEDRLRSQGAQFAAGAHFQPRAIRDGNLVTAQNPASSEKLSALLLQALTESGKAQVAA